MKIGYTFFMKNSILDNDYQTKILGEPTVFNAHMPRG